MKHVPKLLLAVCVAVFVDASALAQRVLILRCEPAKTTASIELSATLHTVHGSFGSKQCELHFDPANGAISGEVVFDAASGKTGNVIAAGVSITKYPVLDRP